MSLLAIWLLLPKLMPFEMSDTACIISALVVNASANVAEDIRSGIQAVDDGQREADQEAFDTQQEGVLHQCPELDIREESGEVFESDPNGVLGEDIVTGHEILEGDQNTIDGQVVEQEYDEYGRKQENQERVISLYVLTPDLELGLLG